MEGGRDGQGSFHSRSGNIDEDTILNKRDYVLLGDEKEKYKELVRERTETALQKYAEDKGEGGEAIKDRVLKKLRNDPGSSLFRLLHEEMWEMRNNPRKNDLAEGLRGVRDVLINLARTAGVFDSLNSQISEAQEAGDWDLAEEAVDKIRVNYLEERTTGQVDMYNRTSPDFGGMNEAYVEGARIWMTYAKKKAEARIDRGEGNIERSEHLDAEADAIYLTEIEYKTWGKDRSSLVNMAYRKIKKEREEREERRPAAPVIDSEAIRGAVEGGVRDAMGGKEIPPEKRYDEFLENERWAIEPFTFNPEYPPSFYNLLNREKKEEFKARVRLHQAAYEKRINGWSLKGLSENRTLNTFTKQETALLYKVPGVRRALETYVTLLDHPESAVFTRDEDSVFTITGSKDRKDSEHIRHAVAEWGYESFIRQGINQEEAKQLAYEAEQIAFNLHYIGGTFESLDGEWVWDKKRKTRVRKRGPEFSNSDFCHAPLQGQMAQMNALIGQLLKPDSRRNRVGRLSEWAARQTQNSMILRRALEKIIGREKDLDFDEVVIIDDDKKGNRDKFWTIERFSEGRQTKHRLYAPLCYPIKSLGSVWEEAEFDLKDERGKKVKRSMLDYLRNRMEIPWDVPEVGDSMWSRYVFDASKEAVIWGAYEGLDDSNIQTEAFKSAVARRKKADNKRMIRWIIKCTEGINLNSRPPVFDTRDKTSKMIIDSRYSTILNTRDKAEIFFPWE